MTHIDCVLEEFPYRVPRLASILRPQDLPDLVTYLPVPGSACWNGYE